MKIFNTVCLVLITAIAARAERINIAEDDATQGAYGSGWNAGSNGGSGFGAWILQNVQNSDKGESHSGFYIVETSNNLDLNNAGMKNKAFGEFANGIGFEQAVAFRPISNAIGIGETFSFLFEHGAIEKKFATDDAGTGGIGITIRTGNQATSCEDYNKGARFEFGFYEGKNTYQVYDGDTTTDTGVAFTDAGVSVSMTLVTADTYDLEITTLSDNKTTKLAGRKLGGTAGGALESFCVFDRDGEKYDAFFNGFQVSKDAK